VNLDDHDKAHISCWQFHPVNLLFYIFFQSTIFIYFLSKIFGECQGVIIHILTYNIYIYIYIFILFLISIFDKNQHLFMNKLNSVAIIEVNQMKIEQPPIISDR